MALTAPSAIAGLTTATLTFDYETIQETSTDRIYKIGTDWVLVAPKSVIPTRPPRLVARDVDGKIITRRAIGGQDVVLRERDTQPLTEQVDIGFYEDGEQLPFATMPVRGNFDIKFNELPSLIEVPPPPPPPVLDKWQVIYPQMNVRTGPGTSYSIASEMVAGDQFNNAGIGSSDSRYDWLQIYETGNWIASKDKLYNVTFCKLAIDITPTTPTVQLTGNVRLEQRPDGYHRLSNVPRVGFNLRNFFYYSNPAWQDLTLDWMKDNGFHWIRAYAPKVGYTPDQSLALIETGLLKASARGIKVCLVAADSIRDSGHILNDLIPWHVGSMGHLFYEFFTSGIYTTAFFPWLDRLATEFGSDIGMYDIMNEPALYPRDDDALTITQTMTDAFVDCFAEACRIVYSRTNGVVPSTVGWINANHFKPAGKLGLQHARDTAKAMQYMQVWGNHLYAEPVTRNPAYHPDAPFVFEEDTHNMDFVAAKETGKAINIPEFGSHEDNWDRAQSIANFRARNEMAEVMFYWGVCPLTEGQGGEFVVNTGDCDAYSLTLARDGAGEFWDCVAAAKA